jgi:hypothetical protein
MMKEFLTRARFFGGDSGPFAPAMVFIDETVIGKYRGASVEISRGN